MSGAILDSCHEQKKVKKRPAKTSSAAMVPSSPPPRKRKAMKPMKTSTAIDVQNAEENEAKAEEEAEEEKQEHLESWNEPAKDFVNLAADRKWGEDSLKKYARDLQIKAANPVDLEGCTLTKMVQRKVNFIVQFKKNRKLLGQITLGVYKDQIMFAANVLLYAAGAGYSAEAWGRIKKALKPPWTPDAD